MRALWDRSKLPLAVFAVALAVFAATAGGRLRRASSDPHFVVQAEAWLHGRLDIAAWPAGADDPAKVEEVKLKNGEVLRGRRIASRKSFRATSGREVPEADIDHTLGTKLYVSFPAFPAVLMVPQVALFGRRANDVGATVLLAALVPALLLMLLRRLREAGLSERSVTDDLWLTALLAFGTVFYFSAVQGRVWFTAHVVGVLLAILYAWASIEAAHPVLAGLFLAFAVVTRTPMVCLLPLFVLEAWRAGRTGLLGRLLRFALPVAAVGLVAVWYNYARFGNPFEFGHSYLAVRQQAQIERHGLFSLHYLERNLAVAFTLLPDFFAHRPWIKISGHGLAMWFTTPALFLLLWPKVKPALHRTLWLCVALVAGWSLLYQNSGWLQFGYRFSLDYIVLLVMLLAIGGRQLGRTARALIVVGIVVNLFGAVTFQRMPRFYDQSYDCVVKN